MPTNYPGSLDAFTNPSGGTLASSSGAAHSEHHANAYDAIEAIQAAIGTNPAGIYSTLKERLEANEAPPVQWLVANRVGNNSRPQSVPSGVWTPIHWGRYGGNNSGILDTTVGRPTEGLVSSNVVKCYNPGDPGTVASLVPDGPRTIEITAGGIAAAGLATPTALHPRYLIIEDTTDLTSQIVRYTGLSAGTGPTGGDEVTGVTLGSWALVGGTRYNVRQAAPYLIDPTDKSTAIGDNYLSCLFLSVGWEGDLTETGWRRTRQTTWFNFGGIKKYPAFQGPDVKGGYPSDGIQVCQMAAQPGFGETTVDPLPHFCEVYQDSGRDLVMFNGPPVATEQGATVIGPAFPAYTCLFNAWFTSRE